MFSKFFDQAKQRSKRQEQRPEENMPRKRPRPRRPKRHGSSSKEEALQLSEKILTLTRKKQIDAAVDLYWSSPQRDDHHACILVDAFAKSGRSVESEAMKEILHDVKAMNVQIQTALLKGLAMEGNIHRATAVFAAVKRPNVRTLNTFLRGCLWAPTTYQNGTLCGGIVSAEEAWGRFSKRHAKELDYSSYEYYVTLQCQALQTDRAQQVLQDLMKREDIRVKGKASVVGGDQSALETLGTMYLQLARAHFLLGKANSVWNTCQLGLSAVKGSKVALSNAPKKTSDDSADCRAKGGKRGWKKDASQDRREESNRAYRLHRLDETEKELKKLITLRTKCSELELQDDHLVRRFIVFAGGGMMQLGGEHDDDVGLKSRVSGSHLLAPLWMSFGLARLCKTPSTLDNLIQAEQVKKVSKSVFLDKKTERLCLAKLFADVSRPLDVELGAGLGHWIQHQAKSRPQRNHLAVELRADRAHQIFTNGHLAGLENLCTVNAESGLLLEKLADNVVSHVFVNFPEPPTQTLGNDLNVLELIQDGGEEPAHMLHSRNIRRALRCLKSKGMIVVVTDNFSYARLLCSTFTKVLRQKGPISTVLPDEITSLQDVGQFGDFSLYEGLPNESLGYTKLSTNGSSYFDRLWRTGAGTHSERSRRFVVLARRTLVKAS